MSYGTVQAEKMTTESGYSLGAGNASSFKNRIINGAMVIDQRGSASSPVNSGADTYFVDRWCMFATAGAIFNGRQSSVAPAGFTNSALFTSTAASSPSAGNATGFRQKIEGFNIADLGWGTANAKTVTLSFWARSSITGTYAVSLFNADSSGPNRSYVATYTIDSANTFEYKTITIAGETTGTWNTTNGQGIQVWWDLGSGSNLNGTAGVWNSSLATRTSGSTNWSGTNGATFYITGVQLEVGTVATSFDFRDYGDELIRCKRYYEQLNQSGSNDRPFSSGAAYVSGGNVISQTCLVFEVEKRTTPSVTFSAASTFSQHGPGAFRNTLTNIALSTASVTTLQIAGTSGSGGGSPSVQGLACLLESSGSGTASIGISAEL